MSTTRLTSPRNTSNVLSLPSGPIFSISGVFFSKLHTDTRLFVVLCEADCTRHGPTRNKGAPAGVGKTDVAEEDPGTGVPVLLLVAEAAEGWVPML